MDIELWVANAGSNEFHIWEDAGPTTLCGEDVSGTGVWGPMSPGDVEALPFEAGMHVTCYSVWARTHPAGGSMSNESVTGTIERLRSLRAEGNSALAADLAAEAREEIKKISGKGSVATRRELTASLEAALATPLPPTSPDDYTIYDGVPALVAQCVDRFRAAASLETKRRKIAQEIADIQLDIKLRIPRLGLPDLEGRSMAVRASTAAILAPLRDEIPEEDLLALQRSANYYGRKALGNWLAALDTSEEAQVREFFPTLPADVHGGFTSAVLAMYADAGITIAQAARQTREVGPAERTLSELERGHKMLQGLAKSRGALPITRRAELKSQIMDLAAQLMDAARTLDTPAPGEAATERVRKALPEGLPADSEDAFRAAAEAALDLPAGVLRSADWGVLYGAYSAEGTAV